MRASDNAFLPTRARIGLITPLRDEENYIDGMIASIVKQQVRPVQWIIVDDGSSDRTPAIVQEYCREFAFIRLIQLPSQGERLPGGEGAIASAIQALEIKQLDYIARFDGDLLFEEDYFARLLQEFAENPQLGIAGGGLYVERQGRLELERAPAYHVRGALKMYRRQCFEQLGALSTDIGWDTIDEVYAWSYGWHTRSFFDIRVIHRRPTGGGLKASRIYWERGRAEYLTWSHPLFVAIKTAKLALTNPIAAASFSGGFFKANWNHVSRLQDPIFKRTRRKQQLARIFGPVLAGSGR